MWSLSHNIMFRQMRSKSWLHLKRSESSIKFDLPIITSVSNEKIKLVRSLQMKKKRNEHNLIVLEGGRQIVDAIKSNLVPEHIFFTTKALDYPLGHEVVKTLSTSNKNAQLITEDVFDSVSETKHGQGIIATFQKPPPLSKIPTNLQATPSTPLLFVILDRLSDPGNVGTILRSCYGLGVDLVFCVESCDVYSSKVLRSAMGVCLKLPTIECDWKEVETYLQEYQQHLQCESTTSMPVNQDSKNIDNSNNNNNSNTDDTNNDFSHLDSASDTLQKQSSCNGGVGTTDSSEVFVPPLFQVILADGNDNNIAYDSINYSTKHTVLVIGSEANGISNEAVTLLNGGVGNGTSDSGNSSNSVAAKDASSAKEDSAASDAEFSNNNSWQKVENYAAEVENCSVKVKIPMSRKLESFNAAVAGSIILAEIHRQRLTQKTVV